MAYIAVASNFFLVNISIYLSRLQKSNSFPSSLNTKYSRSHDYEEQKIKIKKKENTHTFKRRTIK